MTDSERYVHRPDRAPGGDATADAAGDVGAEPDEAAGFDGRGWVLVAAVVCSVLVIPGIIYLYPSAPVDAGIPFLVAMLALPLVPAVLLGLTAVWSMTAATRGERKRD